MGLWALACHGVAVRIGGGTSALSAPGERPVTSRARERVTERTDPLLNVETFQYHGQGDLRFATDRKGQAIEVRYDLADRLVKRIMRPGQPAEVVRDIAYDLMDP